jgi:hypothetical protein
MTAFPYSSDKQPNIIIPHSDIIKAISKRSKFQYHLVPQSGQPSGPSRGFVTLAHHGKRAGPGAPALVRGHPMGRGMVGLNRTGLWALRLLRKM